MDERRDGSFRKAEVVECAVADVVAELLKCQLAKQVNDL